MADDNGVNPAIAAILGIAGAGAGKYFGNQGAQNAVPPQLSQLLQMSADRAAFQQPLAQAQTQGIYSMLPNFARQGTQLGSSIQGAAPQPSGGGMNPALAAALGAGGMGALDALMGRNGGSIPFDAIIKGLKKLFGGGGRDTVQGNQPNAGGTGFENMGTSPSFFGGWDPSVSDPRGNPYLPSDPGTWWGSGGGGAMPMDPSGGTGVGPGMQGFYGGGTTLSDPNEE